MSLREKRPEQQDYFDNVFRGMPWGSGLFGFLHKTNDFDEDPDPGPEKESDKNLSESQRHLKR